MRTSSLHYVALSQVLICFLKFHWRNSDNRKLVRVKEEQIAAALVHTLFAWGKKKSQQGFPTYKLRLYDKENRMLCGYKCFQV